MLGLQGWVKEGFLKKATFLLRLKDEQELTRLGYMCGGYFKEKNEFRVEGAKLEPRFSLCKPSLLKTFFK